VSDFDKAFDFVIRLEGENYVNDPADYGGESKYGISKRYYPEYDIKNLTLDQAKEIYWRDYWHKMLLEQLGDDDFAEEMFEQGINMGRQQAVRHAQMSVNLVVTKDSVDVDGVIGPQTVGAINGIGQARRMAFLQCMKGFQFVRYLEIVKNNPTQKKFFVGWLRRVG